MSAERDRLEEDPAGQSPWRRWGPYSQRTGVGHGARGLQRRRRCVGLLPPRPRPVTGLPLERGRAGRDLRRPSAALLRPGLLERPRPDPQGAASSGWRARRATTARTPRSTGGTWTARRRTRGCAGATCTRRRSSPTSGSSRRTGAGPRTSRSSSCSTPGSSTTGATGRSPPTTPRPTPEDMLHPHQRPQRRAGARRRSTCCRRCGFATPGRGRPTAPRPSITLDGGALVAEHAELGAAHAHQLERHAHRRCSARTRPTPPGCSATTVRLAAATPRTGSTITSIRGAATVNPAQRRDQGRAPPPPRRSPAGETATIELRLRGAERHRGPGRGLRATIMTARERRRPTSSTPSSRRPAASEDEALILRQALAGMLWSKQFYHYDVRRWLDGDPADPPPPPERLAGRNHEWTHLNNLDVISMPDKWEYPWYAAWDLAFHCVALAHVDPEFAKAQLHPALPRVVHAPQRPAARLRVELRRRQPAGPRLGRAARLRDRRRRRLRLPRARVLHKLLLNFTWWVNRKDVEGDNLFEGGFLGPRQHRPLRPLPSSPSTACSSSPTARRGWRCTARTCSRWR